MATIPKPSNASAVPRRQTLLIVDDEPDIRESLSSLLVTSIPNLRCVVARDGPEGLRILREERVDLIVCDYKMPGMDGLEFLRLARAQAPQVPRIMVTAFPDLEVATKAINDGRIESFLGKPLDPPTIVATVQRSLEDRRAKQDRDMALARALGRVGED